MKIPKLIVILLLLNNVIIAQQMDSIRYVLDSANAASPFFGNVLVTKNGKTIFEKSYGYADALNQQPLTPKNSFQLASISKQFTAYGIMLLQHKRLLEYDSLVVKYLPAFPYSNITIRHLLNHTSGLPNFWDDIRPKMDTLKSFGNKEVLDYLIVNKLPLQFTPGSSFDYCDIGYDFLANIIEHLSGLGYDVFMQKHIFKPLGMKQTYAYKVTDIRRIKNRRLAIGHVLNQQQFAYAHEQAKYNFVFYLGDFYGDGSLVSTARDLAKWDAALTQCRLLPCTQQTIAFQVVNIQDSTYLKQSWGYGFGWFISQSTSPQIIYHTGFHPGNTHGIYRLVDKGITLIFLSNAETPSVRKTRSRVLNLLHQ